MTTIYFIVATNLQQMLIPVISIFVVIFWTVLIWIFICSFNSNMKFFTIIYHFFCSVQPVNDTRRLRAILPYNNIPDTDELRWDMCIWHHNKHKQLCCLLFFSTRIDNHTFYLCTDHYRDLIFFPLDTLYRYSLV